jgi:DNA-binding MarR family transcriptional regulator
MEQARIVHFHAQRFRSYILSGTKVEEDPWEGMPKNPTMPQIRSMLAINMLGPCTLKEFTQSLNTSGAAGSEMVDRLVELGLVTRRQDQADRRRVLIDLTEEARERVRIHEEGVLRQVRALMDKLGPEWSARWVELAEKISDVLDAEGFPKAPTPPEEH